jgi:glycosyltransferase involved in cell wall biosynthesis
MFVLPSEREGMPLVILEAMAMGLPVVATDVTGTKDIVANGKNGLLVPFGDVAAFRSALQKIKADPKLFSDLSKKSHKMASQYSWPKIAEQFNGLYEEVDA